MPELHPTTRIRFHGIATYEIITRDGKRILCDPFLDDSPVAPVKHDGFDKVDLVIVSHAASDHLGDTDKIALKYGCPVVCGGEVKAWLIDRDVPPTQIMVTTWGIRVEVAGIRVLPLECHHWSQIRLKDGSFISGVPMAFIIYADEGVRFYHYGDTAIFSDLRLHGELYRPNVGAIGIASPREIMQNLPVPGYYSTSEMDAREGLMAAEWLGLEMVLPCHYCNPEGDPDVEEFMKLRAEGVAAGRKMPEVLALRAGDWIAFDPSGRRVS